MGDQAQKTRSSTPTSLRSSLEMKSFMMEKEMLEGQMRKLSLENSTLEMENKLLKDKYNRSAARVSELESKLQETEEELHETQTNLASASSRASLAAKTDMERQMEQQQWKANSALKEVDVLKSELKFMEQQVESLKKELEVANQNADRTKMHEAHKEETESLKSEIGNLKRLLEESDVAVEAESARCQEMSEQVKKLCETRDVLQLQVEEGGSGGSAAEKQITSLETRLHLTEERLTQERSDRAGNLSQIEEKLLTENAKLQTKGKELDRQLKREKEKTRSLEQRVQEFREESLQLRLAMPDEDEQTYDIPYKRQSHQDSKKPAYDVQQVLAQLEAESGLSRGEENGLLLYLWGKHQGLRHQQKEWRLYLGQLDLPEGDQGVEGLQGALAVKQEYETKMQQNQERMEDISAERITAEQTYKQQLTELVKERHDAFARLQTLNDLMDALRAENESLRQSLAATSGNLEARPIANTAEVESLREVIAGLEAKLGQVNRKTKVSENEMSTLRGQLASRDKELREILVQLEARKAAAPVVVREEVQVKAERAMVLNTEVASVKEQLRSQTDKTSQLQTDNHKLEAELESVRTQLKLSQKKCREQDLGSSLNRKQAVEELESEIERRDTQILQLTGQKNESEAALHQARSDLAIQHKTQQELEAQLESIQRQLDERCQVLDALSGQEGEQLEQLNLVKEMLHSLNQGLSQKQGEMEVLQLELQQAKDKISWLEDEKSQLTAQLADVPSAGGQGHIRSTPAATDLRVGELEAEREEMRSKVLQSTSAAVSLKEEVETLNAEVVKAKQKASGVATGHTQLANEKAVLERRLKTLEEEKRMKTEERDACMQDLTKLEASFHEVVSSFESDSKRKYDNFSTEYKDDSPQGQKLIGELQTLRLLTFAKGKEHSAVMDKLRRQEDEKKNLGKMCELLQSENDQGRKDVSRITNELVLKMKENSAAMEVNRVLLRDQNSTQKKLAAMENQYSREKERTERRKAEVSEVIKKIEQSEQSHMATSLTLQQRDSVIGDLEVKVRQLNQDLSTTQSERELLKAKVDQMSEDFRSLSNVNTSLEKKLETKEADLSQQKGASTKHKEELVATSHQLEVAKHEQNLLLGNLSTERKTQEKLKEEIKSHEDEEKRLREKIAEVTGELETQKGQLVAARETIQQTKAEKEIFMKDYQDACRRLGEKESSFQELQRRSEEEITVAKQEMLQHSQAVSQEKATKDRDLQQLREEIENLKSQLQKKDSKLSEFELSVKELQDAQRQNKELESYISEQDKIGAETKMLVESLRKELMSLRDDKSDLQDTIARKEVVILDLKDQLRSSGEHTESQVVEMRHTIEGMRSHHEYEKKQLREALNKVEDNMKQSVQEVRSLMETKEQLTEQIRTSERSLTEANYKLSQEVASRKVAEEKYDQLRETLEDCKKKKSASEEKTSSLQLSLSKAESDHTIMRDRIKHLSGQLKDMETALSVSETANKTGDVKVDSLKAELVRHQQMLENLKQQSNSKLRKANLELKQLSESHERDQVKLTQQCHQLSVDLEQARETLAGKSKENLKLQEEVLELQGQVREGNAKLRQTQDSLKQEEQIQSQLSYR